ncbi:unnamed protein product [Caretta caretta]
MCRRARAFYAGLSSPVLTDPNACRVLWNEFPTVNEGDRDRLELPLTLAEFLEALCHMPTNTSPGMDGLTVEFYHAFWDVLGPDLVTVWAESLQNGVVVKAISLRLGSVLADVIHPDQTNTVLGLTIFDNLYLVRDLLELRCRDGLSFALLSLDQEKAFDKDLGDLAQVEACQAIYSAASSARVNWVKSSGLVVGDWWQGSSLPPPLQAIW